MSQNSFFKSNPYSNSNSHNIDFDSSSNSNRSQTGSQQCSYHNISAKFFCVDKKCIIPDQKCCAQCFMKQNPHASHDYIEIREQQNLLQTLNEKTIYDALGIHSLEEQCQENQKEFFQAFVQISEKLFDVILPKNFEQFYKYTQPDVPNFVEKIRETIMQNPEQADINHFRQHLFQDLMPNQYAAAESLKEIVRLINFSVHSALSSLDELTNSPLINQFHPERLYYGNSQLIENLTELQDVNVLKGIACLNIIDHPSIDDGFIALILQQSDQNSQTGYIARGELKKFTIQSVFKGPLKEVSQHDVIYYSQQQNVLCVSSYTQQVMSFFDIDTQSYLGKIQMQGNVSDFIAFKDGDSLLLAQTKPNRVSMWCLESQKEKLSLPNESAGVLSISTIDNRQQFVFGDEEGYLKLAIIQIDKGIKLLESIKPHKNNIYSITSVPQQDILLTGSRDYSVGITKISSFQVLKILQGAHSNRVWKDVFWINETSEILSIDLSREFILWNLEQASFQNITQIQCEKPLIVGRITFLYRQKFLVWTYGDLDTSFWKITE